MSVLPSPRPPHAVWLVLPEIERAIESTLRRRGVRGPDLEDQRQIVLQKALEIQQPPGSLGECIALVQKIARDRAINTYRQNVSRSKYDAGLCEDPDERAPLDDPSDSVHPIDARRQLDSLMRDIDSGNLTHRQAAILERVVLDEMPQPEVAAELNLAHQTVRNELAAARRTARASWTALTGVALFAVAALFWWRSRPPEVAHGYNGPDDTRPGAEQTPLSPHDRARVDEMRREGLRACDEREWRECLRDLDGARALDPAGDLDPALQKVRAGAEKALQDVHGQAASKENPPAR